MVFKQIRSGFAKFFTPNRIFIMVVFLILAYALMSYSNSKQWNTRDSLVNAVDSGAPSTPSVGAVSNSATGASSQTSAGAATVASADYFPATVTNPADLLPRDENSAWASSNPGLKANGVQTPDLLQAGSLIGLDTIGQSLRNANLQLRSDPPIPHTNVGPWNNSTIEPDLIRAPFDINP